MRNIPKNETSDKYPGDDGASANSGVSPGRRRAEIHNHIDAVDIIGGLVVRAEYEELGVRTRGEPKANGWLSLPCHRARGS